MVGRSNVLLSEERMCIYRSLLELRSVGTLSGDFLKRGGCSGSGSQRQEWPLGRM